MSDPRFITAKSVFDAGQEQVATTPEPKGQKFPNGSRVRIADDLGDGMRHFPSGRGAAVLYTYAHAYGGCDVKSYALNIDGDGFTAWYREHQLTAIKGD